MPDNPQTIRTFIALPLPHEWTATLAAIIAELNEKCPTGIRWVNPQGIHLTLKFLGATEPALAPRLVDSLATAFKDVEPPALMFSSLGTFPGGANPRVIWAGVSGDLDTLAELQVRVDGIAARFGWETERRPFRPHLTIGRVRDRVSPTQRRRIGETIPSVAIPPASRWLADTVRLYRSDLTPRGAIYTNLGEVKI